MDLNLNQKVIVNRREHGGRLTRSYGAVVDLKGNWARVIGVEELGGVSVLCNEWMPITAPNTWLSPLGGYER